MLYYFTYMIPEHELHFSFVRSSGAGGQNVNKVASKVVVHWSVGKSGVFSVEEKQRLRTKLVNRLNSNDEVVISSAEERSQMQNRGRAVMRLRRMVAQALRINKKRRLTRPTKAAKIKRLQNKKMRSWLKQSRRAVE